MKAFFSLFAATMLAALWLVPPAMAQTAPVAASSDMRLTGSGLYTLCASSSNIDYGMCAGYVRAVADLMLTEPVGGQRACAFDLVRIQQMIDIVRNYLDQTPDALENSARMATAKALARAFPCP